MAMIPVLSAETRWTCPNCPTEQVTRNPKTVTLLHPCPKFAGLSVPLVRAGTKAKIVAVEREDYINGDKVFLHQGRPVMAVVTTRDNGEDRTVFAPTARARVGVR